MQLYIPVPHKCLPPCRSLHSHDLGTSGDCGTKAHPTMLHVSVTMQSLSIPATSTQYEVDYQLFTSSKKTIITYGKTPLLKTYFKASSLVHTKILIVKAPALVALSRWSTLLQPILTIHVIFFPQIFIFQHFICTVDTQKVLVCFRIILDASQHNRQALVSEYMQWLRILHARTHMHAWTAFMNYHTDRFFWATRVLILVYPYFSFLVPCARLSWPSHQFLSTHKYTISYCIIWSY